MPTIPPPKSYSGPEEHLRWGRGELRIRVTEEVVYEQVTGYLESGVVAKITQPIDRLIATGSKPIIFNDWWDLTGYDTDARLKLTDWIFWIRGKIVGSHILVRSKIVSMGVSIANLALGGMLTVYTDRGEFALAYHRAMRQSLRPAPPSERFPPSDRGVPSSQPVSSIRPSSERSPERSPERETQRPPRTIR
jgi:hypothetical protein